MAAPTEDHFPRPYCRSRRGRNGLGSETIFTDNCRLSRGYSFAISVNQTMKVSNCGYNIKLPTVSMIGGCRYN